MNKETNLDVIQTVDDYLDQHDWRVNENSNVNYSFPALMFYLAEKNLSKYTLEKYYKGEIASSHKNGDIHIHDLGMGIAAYCCGHSLKDLLQYGFNGVYGMTESKPANHLDSALWQVINFIGVLQNQFSGAQAFNSFDTLLAPFVKKDNLTYKQVRQAIQGFIFNMNIPSRWSMQTPFSNLSFDWVVPKDMRKNKCLVGGKLVDFTYGDCQKEMDMINKAFLEVMIEGDSKGRIFTFPIPTYNITKDFDWDSSNTDLLFEATAKYGIPYFQNFINSDLDPSQIRSMCCRLSLDVSKLEHRGGGLFGSNDKTGCYSEDTEILTENGWKLFKDLNKQEKVATMNQQTKNIEFHKPKKYFKYKYDGYMYNFTSKNMNLLVTPNHRMYINNKFKLADKVRIKDSIPNSVGTNNLDVDYFYLPKITKQWVVNNGTHNIVKSKLAIKMDDWLAFIGIFLSEGSVYHDEKQAKKHGYRVTISQVKKHTKKEIRNLLHRLPFNFSEFDNGFNIYNMQLYNYLKQFGNVYNKYIDPIYFKCSKRQLNILLDWLIKGDGTIRKLTGSRHYWTTSEKLKNDIQKLCVYCGYHVNTSIQKNKESVLRGKTIKSKKPCYILSILRSKNQNIMSIKKQKYSGDVFCVEVKNNIVLVKRKDKVSWCGNSIGVITINMPRIGYLSETEDEYFNRLQHQMILAKKSLETKRKVIEEGINNGLFPHIKRYLGNFNNHFSTIGLVGMNESIKNFYNNEDITTEKGKNFALRVLRFMNEQLIKFQEETGHLYNLEATPAEGTSYRLARIDKKHYPEIITAGDEEPYYTNSTQLPVDFTDDMFEALDIQDDLQCSYTGGTVNHLFLGERVVDSAACKKLVKTILSKYKLPYLSITPTFSICPTHGYKNGEHTTCPECGKECEIFSRVVGYIRPVKQWNKGKQQEYSDRVEYKNNNQ